MKRVWGRLLRLGAILFVAAAGVLPILQQIFTAADGKPPFAPAWASVLISVALLLIAIDRFFGYSSAWMRYITAERQIKETREAFEMDWQTVHASFGGKAPTPAQISAVLASAKTFLERVNEIVTSETAKWVAEFREALKQTEEGARAAAPAAQTGSLNVIVQNGDQGAPPGWVLSVDHAPGVTYAGKSAGLAGLMAGDHVVRISAKIGGKAVLAESVVTIPPGSIKSVELSTA